MDRRRLLEAVFDSLSEQVAALDADGTIVAVNRSWLQFGRANNSVDPGNEGVGANYLAVCDKATGPFSHYARQVARGLRAVLAGRSSEFMLEYPCPSPEEDRWFLLRLAPLHNGIKGAIAIHLNITYQKEAAQRLLEAGVRHHLILDSLGEGIAGLDPDGRINYVNRGLLNLTGYTEEELLGIPIHTLLHHSYPDGRPYPEEACPVLKTLHERAAIVASDEWLWRRDGSGFPADLTTIPIWSQGRFVGAVVTIRDLTQRRQLEEKQRQLSVVQEADRLKTQFLNVLSHELRTPLSLINGYAGILMHGIAGPLSPEQQAYVAKIVRSVGALTRLVNDILDMGRSQAGRLTIQWETLQVREIIQNVLDDFLPAFQEKGIELEVTMPEGLPQIAADRLRIEQVLVNLVGNALKFTPSGGRVTVRASARDGRLRVEVADTGPGIAVELQDRLFRPFSQLDMGLSRKSAGAGLGLSISKAIVEAHGGVIGVHSQPGRGSTFWFELLVSPPKSAG